MNSHADIAKTKAISIAGTLGFHILLIIFLLLYYIKPNFDTRWSETLEGVPVMFGNVPDAYGDDEPYGRGDGQTNDVLLNNPVVEETNISTPSQTESRNNADPVVTQNFEETVALREENAKKEAEARRQAEAKAEADRVAAEEARKKKEIEGQMQGLFGNGTGSGSRGNTTGTGTQGVPTGNASYGKTSGVGGWGTYDLGGRGVGRGGLVKPSYTANDYGTVVIDIIVDPKGNVVEATIGRGTNTTSSTLKNEALSAARKTKFNEVNRVGNQKGTITYMFNLN